MSPVRDISFVVLAFVGLLAFLPSAWAQALAPNCTVESWSWTDNSLDQSPCTVAAYLEAVCSGGSFEINPLIPGNVYTGPTKAEGGNICMCNTVVYSLISACDACQGSPWTSWSEYNINCTGVTETGSLPSELSIPSGTRVPHWAFLNLTDDSWDNVTSFTDTAAALESTASTGPTTINPSSPSTAPPSQTTGTSSNSATSSAVGASGGSSSHTGAIAGGVVGGVVGAAALAAIVAFFVIRRRRASRVPPSAMYTNAAAAGRGGGSPGLEAGGYGSGAGQWDQSMPAMSEMPGTPRKYYDPSDPSTFPTSPSPSSPTIHTTANTYNSGKGLQPNRSTYAGLPEV